MDDLHRYIYFQTLDYTGMYTTSGYTLPITPFTFIPIFDDGDGNRYSKQKIFWDFGDGTTSNSVTAVHSFELPGWYNVKCYVLGGGGVGYQDKFSQLLLVRDYISDTIVMSGYNNKTEVGTRQNPYEVFRFNSWQSYNSISASGGYVIKLHVNGNNAPLLNTEKYKHDKWGHLKPSSRFETSIKNSFTGKYDILPVNELITSNEEIYVKLQYNKIVLCSKNDPDSCFAGTSGSKTFYYIDDIPKVTEKFSDVKTSTIFATFDTTKFKDNDIYIKKYPELKYPLLNNIFDTNSFSIMMQRINSDHMTITSNGIDDDNNGNLIDTFNIFPEKFTGQKIPFVAKVKDGNEIPSKGNPVMKIINTPEVSAGFIYIELRNNRNQKIEGVKFESNLGVLSSEKFGGYFKGYLISENPFNDVHLYACTVPLIKEEYLVDTNHAVINEPQFEKIHNLIIKTDINDATKKTIEDKIYDIPGLSGIYSSCIVSRRKADASVISYLWLVDADKDTLRKYDLDTMELVYKDFIFPENSSPSNICADSRGNVWITLYDSISVIKINDDSNFIEQGATIVSTMINEENDYENTITPASIDTDYLNNIWISYSNQLSSFVEKYDVDSQFLFRKFFEPNYQVTDITTDLNLNLWGIVKDLNTFTDILSNKMDKVFKIDTDNNITYYPIHGSLWNITNDIDRNIWVTKNVNEVSKIDTENQTFSTFNLNPQEIHGDHNYISNLEGITCTTNNNILVVDNFNRKIYTFNSDVEKYGFVPSSVDISNAGTLGVKRIQDKLNGYGDWNGFKFINKYQHIFATKMKIEGISNAFSIYDSISGKYDIRKINENFDAKEQINAYRFQSYLDNQPILFDNFIGNVLGSIDSRPTELGKCVYERISNFLDNNNNIDTCNIRALKSMYEMLDENFYTFSNVDYNLPADLNRLVDIFSINFTKLKGSRNKFDGNFNNKGYQTQKLLENGEDVLYGNNKGDELDFFTSVLTAGKNIIAYEKFSETYKIINTDILLTNYVDFIDDNRTYVLSSYSPYWGWGLCLPDTYTNDKIVDYYTFYEYVTGYVDIQTEGVLNWSDPYNTIRENLSSVEEWNEIKYNMITYSLAKGLGIIK